MIRMAVFDTKPYDRQVFEACSQSHDVEFKFFDARLNEDTAGLAAGQDCVCAFVNDTVDSRVIDRLVECNVRLIALRCAGFNNVDVRHAFGRIHVVRVPSYSPNAVAEHAMAMLLTSIRRIHKAYNRTRDFNFSLNGLTGFNLCGKTVGVVGTGKIGRAFISICRGFGMNVLAYDLYPDESLPVEYTTLDDLCRRSDIISLHCPLTGDNRHMINSDRIDSMKRGVVLVNTSRGALIASEDLLDGIKSRRIGAACLDVYEEESDLFFEDNSGHILSDDTLARLLSMPNVIITSHQAFLTREALENIAQTTLDNVECFFAGENPENEVCYRCGKTEECRKKRLEKCF